MPQKPLSTQAAQTDQHHSTSTKSKPDAPRNSGGLNTGGLGFVITRPDRAARLPMPEPVPMGGDGHRLKVGDLQDTWRQWPKPTNPCCSSGATRSPGGAEMCTTDGRTEMLGFMWIRYHTCGFWSTGNHGESMSIPLLGNVFFHVFYQHLHSGVTWLEAPTLPRDLHWTPVGGSW